MITTTPATMLKTMRCVIRNFPTHVAEAPRITKTTVKPTINASEFRSTRAINCPLASFFNSSIDAPESIETYPGTSGNTQGERNETMPARKAMGILNSCDDIYCRAPQLVRRNRPEIVTARRDSTLHPCPQFHHKCTIAA